MMSKNSNYSQWPKALVAIAGMAIVGSLAYFLHDAEVLWGILLIIWLVSYVD